MLSILSGILGFATSGTGKLIIPNQDILDAAGSKKKISDLVKTKLRNMNKTVIKGINTGLQKYTVIRFREKIIPTGFHAFCQAFAICGGRQENDRNKSITIYGFNTPGGFIAIHIWHFDIHQNQVRMFAMENVNRLHSVIRQENAVTLFFEDCLKN